VYTRGGWRLTLSAAVAEAAVFGGRSDSAGAAPKLAERACAPFASRAKREDANGARARTPQAPFRARGALRLHWVRCRRLFGYQLRTPPLPIRGSPPSRRTVGIGFTAHNANATP